MLLVRNVSSAGVNTVPIVVTHLVKRFDVEFCEDSVALSLEFCEDSVALEKRFYFSVVAELIYE
jgi:hypothetical protein